MNSRSFVAFQAPGYRWLLGNSFAMSAAWTANSMGQGWLVLQLTDSPFWVGAAVGVRGVSQLLFSVPGGTMVDRLDRRLILVVNAFIAALIALALAVLIAMGDIRLWHILLSMALGGAMGAVDAPAFSALTYDVVGASRLLNANAFRFMAGSLVRIVTALTGGLVIDRLGLGPNYVLVALAFLAAAACLLPLRTAARSATERESPVRALRAGVRYALRTRPVRELLLLSLATEAFGFSSWYMRPVLARDVLHVGATGLGYLEAGGAAGLLAAMALLASLGDFRKKGWLLVGGAFGFGVSIALFGLSPWFLVSLVLSAVVGGMGGIYDSTMSTVVQMTAASEMRGRVLGLYVSTWGSNQIGGFGLGALGTLLGVPVALAISGSIVALNAARLFPQVRLFSPSTSVEAAPKVPAA